MIYWVKYKDEVPARWKHVDEDRVRDVLANYVRDVELAMTDLATGHVVNTPYSSYKAEQDN